MAKKVSVRSELSEESLVALRRLIGQTIFTIYTTRLDATGGHLAAPNLSMLLSKGSFLNFECDWSETPHFMMDSWEINVRASNKPLGLTLNAEGALVDPSSIHIYDSGSIETIDIYRFDEKYEDEKASESVEFDKAVVFRCQEKAFIIGCSLNGPGLADDLHFSENASVIAELTKGATRRLVLDSASESTSRQAS